MDRQSAIQPSLPTRTAIRLNYRLGRKSAGASLKSRKKRCNHEKTGDLTAVEDAGSAAADLARSLPPSAHQLSCCDGLLRDFPESSLCDVDV